MKTKNNHFLYYNRFKNEPVIKPIPVWAYVVAMLITMIVLFALHHLGLIEVSSSANIE